MPNQSRRVVLKGVAFSLPVVWSTPLVESVVLPAHAQTSAPVATSVGGCDSLVIPGLTRTCPISNATMLAATNYTVDDTGPCPVLNSAPASGELPATNTDLPADVLQIQLRINDPDDDFFDPGVRVNIWTTNGASSFGQNCDEPTSDSVPVSLTFEATSGALWQAAGSVVATLDGSFELSDLTLTPL